MKKYSRSFKPFTNAESEKIGEQCSFYEPGINDTDYYTNYKTSYENRKAYQEFIDKLSAEQKTSIFDKYLHQQTSASQNLNQPTPSNRVKLDFPYSPSKTTYHRHASYFAPINAFAPCNTTFSTVLQECLRIA